MLLLLVWSSTVAVWVGERGPCIFTKLFVSLCVHYICVELLSYNIKPIGRWCVAEGLRVC